MKIELIKEGNTFYPHTEADEEKIAKFSNAIYVCDLKNQDVRTVQQNKALHLWAAQIANLLNTKGLYMKGIFNNNIEWRMELVKEQIIKATIKQIFNIDSTTKLTRKEIDEMIDYVTLAFSTKGIEIPEFPNRQLWNERNNLN